MKRSLTRGRRVRYGLMLLAFLASTGGLLTATAHTVISALPYIINSPGTYVLNSDLTYSGPTDTTTSAIVINSSNVTLDFRGHSISKLPIDTFYKAYAVWLKDRPNVTVKNGS